jgi:TPP-dependent pyruvate/acetoin dehydrogenase alpha subunit
VSTLSFRSAVGSDDETEKNSMSDPGTTYRTREEVQRMRSTQDPIRGLQRYIEEWGVATDVELKASKPQHFFSDKY